MDDIERVETCLDQVVNKREVQVRDVAVAMQSFVRHCYVGHLEITQENAARLKRMEELLAPLAQRAAENSEKERQCREDRRKILLHVLMWGLPIIIVWLLATFSTGMRLWFKSWIVG